MLKFWNIFARSPVLPHFRVQFPLAPLPYNKLLSDLNTKISSKSPAFFVSFYGIADKPEQCSNLHAAIRNSSDRLRVPVYSFLQDNINGLTYLTATASNQIYANPFCTIGDLVSPTKSYTNLSKLLKFLGVQIEKIGINSEIWNSTQPSSQIQKQFTNKWLKILQQKLQKSIVKERGINATALNDIKNKLISPKQALSLNLINKITTLQQYWEQHFPNNKIVQHRYQKPKNSTNLNLNLNIRQMQTVKRIQQLMINRPLVLTSLQDPLIEVTRQLVEIIKSKSNDQLALQQLDQIIGLLIQKLQLNSLLMQKLVI